MPVFLLHSRHLVALAVDDDAKEERVERALAPAPRAPQHRVTLNPAIGASKTMGEPDVDDGGDGVVAAELGRNGDEGVNGSVGLGAFDVSQHTSKSLLDGVVDVGEIVLERAGHVGVAVGAVVVVAVLLSHDDGKAVHSIGARQHSLLQCLDVGQGLVAVRPRRQALVLG